MNVDDRELVERRATQREAWAAARGYRRSPSHACLLRLATGRRCSGWSADCPTLSGGEWADHVDLWLRTDGRPAALTTQPYGLRDAGRRALDSLCNAYALTWREEPDASWHCPSSGTTLIIIEPRVPLAPRPVRDYRTGTAERRRLLNARICYVCRQPVSAVGGMYHAPLGIVLHPDGPCDATVRALVRVYDRSRRGRWRPWRDVLQRLDALRDARGPRA